MSLPDLLAFFANFFAWLNQILTATIVITALSLLMYSLTFNLHDRAARSFSTVLFAISVVFVGDSFAAISTRPGDHRSLVAFSMVGHRLHADCLLSFSPMRCWRPPAYLARAALRRRANRVSPSAPTFLSSPPLPIGWCLIQQSKVAPNIFKRVHCFTSSPFCSRWLQSSLGSICIAPIVAASPQTQRRRAAYLLIASIALPISVFPYLLLVGGSTPSLHPLIFGGSPFWAFDHRRDDHPDGLRRRLLRHGSARSRDQEPPLSTSSARPFVASIVLGIMVIAGRAARALGMANHKWLPSRR